MKMSNRFKITKRVLAGMIAGIVMTSGVTVNPMKTEAAEEPAVKYVQCSITNGKAEIPVEKDYVFGGWYETEGKENPLKDSVETVSGNTIYAKMVPAQVLSVKMQINSSAKPNDNEKTTMRVISSVDDTNYREVGFEVYLGNNTTEFPTDKISTVYKKLTYKEGSQNEEITATALFGEAAGYLSSILLKVPDAQDSSKIYVRPYWVTLDGTKVQGMARNLHVVDEFNDYISIPINILSKVEVAAGQFTFSYDKDKYEVVEESGFEMGRIFGEDDMDYKVYASSGKIKVLGIASGIDNNVLADGLLANVRFKAKKTENNPEGAILQSTETKCANWSEDVKTVDVWDYKY